MAGVEFLAKVEACQGLDLDELSLLAGLCESAALGPGQTLFAEREPASRLYMVAQGGVELGYRLPGGRDGGWTVLTRVAVDGTFGWSALVPPHRYRLSARAGGDGAVVQSLERGDLETLFEANPRVGFLFMRNLAEVIGRRFHDLQEEQCRQLGFDQMHGW